MGHTVRNIFSPRPEIEPAPQVNLDTPVSLLVDIIQHQDKKIADLENRITNLENNNALNIKDL